MSHKSFGSFHFLFVIKYFCIDFEMKDFLPIITAQEKKRKKERM